MSFCRLIIVGILLAVVPHAAAQEPDPVLAKASSVMGSSRVKSLRFSVAGSGYEVGPDKNPSTWKHIQIGTRMLEIDVDKLSLSKDGRIVTTESPWQEQFDLW